MFGFPSILNTEQNGSSPRHSETQSLCLKIFSGLKGPATSACQGILLLLGTFGPCCSLAPPRGKVLVRRAPCSETCWLVHTRQGAEKGQGAKESVHGMLGQLCILIRLGAGEGEPPGRGGVGWSAVCLWQQILHADQAEGRKETVVQPLLVSK